MLDSPLGAHNFFTSSSLTLSLLLCAAVRCIFLCECLCSFFSFEAFLSFRFGCCCCCCFCFFSRADLNIFFLFSLLVNSIQIYINTYMRSILCIPKISVHTHTQRTLRSFGIDDAVWLAWENNCVDLLVHTERTASNGLIVSASQANSQSICLNLFTF